jgi:hypothetical protein
MAEPTKTARSTSGMASGGTVLYCAGTERWGCRAVYGGSAYTNTRGARQEARRLGWLVNQPGGRRADRSGRRVRLDYCPDCAQVVTS